MKKYILTIIAALFSAVGFAQEGALIDVEGLCIDDKMNYEQFVAKFGKPDRYEENGGESYYLGKDYFHFEDDGIFTNFSLFSDKFSVLTINIPGGIRVGDKLSKLDNFKYGKPVVFRNSKMDKDGNIKYALFADSDFPLIFKVKDGIIVLIYFIYPV